MADERTLARRYARALLGTAEEQGGDAIEKVEADVLGLAEMWVTSTDLRNLMQHPSVPREKKKETFAKLLAGRVSDVTIRFVGLLVEKKRLFLIEDIAQEFSKAADEARGIARARVRTFMPLGDAQREKLRARLARFTNRKTIELEESVDPALLGGIVVRIGDQVLDGSVEGQLRKLRERLFLREDERSQQAAANAVEALKG